MVFGGWMGIIVWVILVGNVFVLWVLLNLVTISVLYVNDLSQVGVPLQRVYKVMLECMECEEC